MRGGRRSAVIPKEAAAVRSRIQVMNDWIDYRLPIADSRPPIADCRFPALEDGIDVLLHRLCGGGDRLGPPVPRELRFPRLLLVREDDAARGVADRPEPLAA